ncbi:MAG: outer membrane lipoprotein LolB [Pseudomonadota bacterium]
MPAAATARGPRLLAAAAVATALLLGGCAATAPASSSPSPATGASSPAAAPSAWSGRLGLQVEGQDSQSFSASFDLKGRPEAGELTLTSPIGSTLAVLQWSPGSATLRSGQGARSFGSLEELVAHATGTAIPVPALFDWLAGTPTPVPGWEPDLRQQAEGRITARRFSPQPNATLRVVLDR